MIKDSYGNTRFFGTYRGTVVDNNDPLGRNRLRLKVPQILGDLSTEWSWAVIPSGASFSVPKIGDGVWVQFEGGDASFPIWVGTFTSTEQPVNIGATGPTGPSGLTGPTGPSGVTVANSPLSLSGPTGASLYLNVGATGGVQAWDADLDAISALTGPTGALKKTAANTWSLDTNTYLTSVTSTGVSTTTTSFNNILSSADNTVQKALDTLDNYSPPAISLDGLSDVGISSPVAGQVVRYSGISWENYELASMAIDHTSSLSFGNGSANIAPIPINSSVYAVPSTSWSIAATYYTFQVPQVGVYEFSYVGTGSGINSSERAVIGLFSGASASTATTQYREYRGFASIAAGMTVGLNAKWVVDVTSTSTYWGFKTFSSNGSGTLAANGTVQIRRIH